MSRIKCFLSENHITGKRSVKSDVAKYIKSPTSFRKVFLLLLILRLASFSSQVIDETHSLEVSQIVRYQHIAERINITKACILSCALTRRCDKNVLSAFTPISSNKQMAKERINDGFMNFSHSIIWQISLKVARRTC